MMPPTVQWIAAVMIGAPAAWLIHRRVYRLKMRLVNWIMLKLAIRWPRLFALQCKTCGAVISINRAEQHSIICHRVTG